MKDKKIKPVGPFTIILQIILFAVCIVIPFIDPEMMDLTPACQFIIACLYGLAALIVILYTFFKKKISKRAWLVIRWLYCLSWAASIAFSYLVLGGLSGFATIFFPVILWLLILWVAFFPDLFPDLL